MELTAAVATPQSYSRRQSKSHSWCLQSTMIDSLFVDLASQAGFDSGVCCKRLGHIGIYPSAGRQKRLTRWWMRSQTTLVHVHCCSKILLRTCLAIGLSSPNSRRNSTAVAVGLEQPTTVIEVHPTKFEELDFFFLSSLGVAVDDSCRESWYRWQLRRG